jgi:ABC-type ATPase with predicted acetyltransferase domain
MTIDCEIRRGVDVLRTIRVQQLEGIFDVPPSQRSERLWHHKFTLSNDWNIGVIVGPSGSGKTTLVRHAFGNQLIERWDWPENQSLLDGFPEHCGIREITGLLCSVGFSSPPAWVRPFAALSNGEQFRVTLARTLAEMPDLAVVDEFTSVVDRTAACIGSAAVAKAVRRRNQKFVAVTCHYDVLDWLQPDWIYEPHTGKHRQAGSARREQRRTARREQRRTACREQRRTACRERSRTGVASATA